MGKHMSSLLAAVLSSVAQAASPKLEFFATHSQRHVDNVVIGSGVQRYSKEPHDSHGVVCIVSQDWRNQGSEVYTSLMEVTLMTFLGNVTGYPLCIRGYIIICSTNA